MRSDLPALRALVKQAEGKRLTQRETAAIKAYQTRQRKKIESEILHKLPKGKYCELAGRQHKLIDDAARRYDLPIGRATIDLGQAIRGLHDLIAQHATAINRTLTDDELEAELTRQKIAKLEKENERLAILVRQAKQETIDRAILRDRLSYVSARLRDFGKSIDTESRDRFNDLLEAIAVEVARE